MNIQVNEVCDTVRIAHVALRLKYFVAVVAAHVVSVVTLTNKMPTGDILQQFVEV
jgi:hypothetical protein